MEINEQQQLPQEEDPFLAFVDFTGSVLGEGGGCDTNGHGTENCRPRLELDRFSDPQDLCRLFKRSNCSYSILFCY